MSVQNVPLPDFSGLTFERVWAMFQETDKKIDLLLENGTAVIAVEAEPEMQDIKRHIKRLEVYREHRSRSDKKEKTIYGAIAGAVFPQEVQQAAIESGFYVIVQSGDTVKIGVPEGFQPKPY